MIYFIVMLTTDPTTGRTTGSGLPGDWGTTPEAAVQKLADLAKCAVTRFQVDHRKGGILYLRPGV